MRRLLTLIRELRTLRETGTVSRRDVAFALWVELGIWLFVEDRKS